MMDEASVLPGTIMLDPGDDPETAWPRIRDLGRAGGLGPLPAARLALAVSIGIGRQHGAAVIQIARVDDAHGSHVDATIHGGRASLASAPPGLVDVSRQHISAGGTVTQILRVNVNADAVNEDPAWAGTRRSSWPA